MQSSITAVSGLGAVSSVDSAQLNRRNYPQLFGWPQDAVSSGQKNRPAIDAMGCSVLSRWHASILFIGRRGKMRKKPN
jgi:hypothetical protein